MFRIAPSPGRRAAVACAALALFALGPAGRAEPAPAGSDFLRFTKDTPDDSRLAVVRHGREVAVFRAGSGVVPDDCARGQGWLPDGTYVLGAHHTAYDGSLVKGYAIELGSKRCHDGTVRSQLFVHSEMTRTGGRGRAENQRWDGPADYTSHGCVKLSPADIKELYRILDRDGWPGTLRVERP
ncbi:L,D-transpeptidase [Streptomyces sp. NPDC049585]|uniref:L,D-transpeptidase n=1 Tax=Streptomyces sp. NPDC049585 TaxID=3155154 RepID=UPI00341661CF